MSSILAAAVVVLALLVVLNLALTLAIIRRLRATEHGGAARTGGPREPFDVFTTPAIGSRIPELELQAESGVPVDTARFVDGGALVAFAAVGCKPCHDQIAELRNAVQTRVSRGERALIVVLAPAPESEPPDDFVDAFDGLAPVVVDRGARIGQEFGIEGYPTYVEFADGRVEHVTALVRDLRTRV